MEGCAPGVGMREGEPPCDADPRIPPKVTRRETEVLRWMQQGWSNADIARILGLSPWTVKNHVQNTLKKLGARNRAHAVSRAIAARLIR